MIEIALINGQSPPAAAGPGKPPGVELQADGTRNDFKEVLNEAKLKSKSNEKTADTPAANETSAKSSCQQMSTGSDETAAETSVRCSVSGGEETELPAETPEQSVDEENNPEAMALDAGQVLAGIAAVIPQTVPVQTDQDTDIEMEIPAMGCETVEKAKVNTTFAADVRQTSTEAIPAAALPSETEHNGTSTVVSPTGNTPVTDSSIESMPADTVTEPAASPSDAFKTSAATIPGWVKVAAETQQGMPPVETAAGTSETAAMGENTQAAAKTPSAGTHIQTGETAASADPVVKQDTVVSIPPAPEMDLLQETDAAKSPEIIAAVQKSKPESTDLNAMMGSAAEKTTVETGKNQEAGNTGSLFAEQAQPKTASQTDSHPMGVPQTAPSREFSDSLAEGLQNRNNSADNHVKTDMMQGGLNVSASRTDIGVEPHTKGTSRITDAHLQQIAREVNLSIQTGKSFARIQLHPKDLGAIDIQLTRDAKGIGITILTEQSSTGRLLEGQMENLRQALSDAGLQLTHMNFGMKEQNEQSANRFLQNNQTGSNQNWYKKFWSSDEGNKNIEMPRMTLGTSMVDYRV